MFSGIIRPFNVRYSLCIDHMMMICFTLSLWFRCGSLKIVPPFTKGDNKAISLNKDAGPFKGLPCYAILRRKDIVQWVGLFWQFHVQDFCQRMNKTHVKVAEHSFQVPMPNSPLLLNYLCFGARFLQESRLTTEVFIRAFWLGCMLLPW